MSDIDDFLAGYTEAMLWANTMDPETGEFWDANPPRGGRRDVPGLDLDTAREFFTTHETLMRATGEEDFSQHGHDLALTRTHHGAGFWARGYGPAGDLLTLHAHALGELILLISEERS